MKKLTLILTTAVMLAACGGSDDYKPAAAIPPVPVAPPPVTPAPAADAFVARVEAAVATMPDDTEAADIDAVVMTTPDDNEPKSL